MAVSYLSRGLFPATVIAVLAVACGARGPLDIIVVEEAPDADVDAAVDVSVVDAADASDAHDAAEEEGGGGFDGGPIVNCGSCVVQSCGTQLLTCIESTTCRTALQCVVTTCLSGGTPDITCIGTCAGSDPTTLADLIGAFTCIIETCGAQCTSVLGGLTGGGGAGAGGGGAGGAGGGGDGG